jgi:hypothetical protein
MPATAQAQCSYRMNDVGRPHGYLSGPCNAAAQGYSGAYPSHAARVTINAHNGSICFLVALPRVQDLLLSAKHLFVPSERWPVKRLGVTHFGPTRCLLQAVPPRYHSGYEVRRPINRLGRHERG